MNPLVPALALSAAGLALLRLVHARSALSTIAFDGARIVVKGGRHHVIRSLADGYLIEVGDQRVVVRADGVVVDDTIVPLDGFTELAIVMRDGRVSLSRDGQPLFDSGVAPGAARIVSSGR